METPQAIAKRLHRRLARLAFASPLYSLVLGRSGPRDLLLVPPDPWPGDSERALAMMTGTYRMGGQSIVGEEPPWLPLGAGTQFLEEMHGFDWLRDLRAAGGDAARRHARKLVGDWIRRFDRWHPVAWRSDVLGRRIANWLGAHDFYCASADDEFRARVFASMSRQIRHLSRAATEVDGPGVILVAKGLVYGGVALPDGQTRLDQARRLLDRVLPRQILPDGGHVQRNPSIHLAMMRHLIDVRAALKLAREDVPDSLQHAIDRMTPALRFFRHGDGGLALFNGASEGEPVVIDTALAQADARGKPLKSARHTGFERVLAGRTLLLFDYGGPPPEGLDEGCHAGALAFELSFGRERMIVNCGSWPGRGTEEHRAWHLALRGTAAHSTLTIADTNAFALDPSGGCSRRPPPSRADRVEDDDGTLIEATHRGYVASFGLAHQRRLWLNAAGDDLRGEDELVEEEPNSETRPFAIRFHLHPQVQASPIQNGAAVLVRLPSGGGWRFRATGGALSVEPGVYVGRDGERRRTSQIVITGQARPVRRGEGGERPTAALVQWALSRERKG